MNEDSLHPIFDRPFLYVIALLTALFVGLFLFLSGYGVSESTKAKGESYVKRIPQHRILQTLLNFDIAVLLFGVLCLLIGSEISIKQVLLSLLAWDSLGNSNWYIFCILLCYFFTYISFKISTSQNAIITVMFFLSILYIIIISRCKGPFWFNTILAYPAGVFYSFYKDTINKFFQLQFLKFFIVILFFFAIFFYLSTNNPFTYNIAAVCFCFLVVIISSKLQINSYILKWCGKHLFNIYIYMRLPMILIAFLWPSVVIKSPFVYCISCIGFTLIIAKYMPSIKI